MSISRRIAVAVSAVWLSRLITIALNLLLIPVMFRFLGSEELGLWFLLGQSGAFLGMMDLGFTPTITRRIAFARAKNGPDLDAPLSDEVRREIGDLIASGAIVYRIKSVVVFLIVWPLGWVFLQQIQLQEISSTTAWTAWTLMCLGNALTVWAGFWSCLIAGMGYMASATVLSFCFGVAAIAVQFLVVLLGGGLIGLSVVSAVSAVALRFCTILFIRSRHPALIALRGRWNRECVRSMIAPALKCWLTEMGAVFLLKTDQYFIAYFQGAAQIPAYHAAYTIVHNMALLCVAIGDVSNVYISHLWQAKNFAMIRIIVLRNLRIGLGLMLCGVALLLFAGDRVMALWLGEGQFVGYPVLATFCLTLTLYVQQSLMLGFSRATENEVYATSFLMAGLLNLVLTWCLVKPFGLLGVALGTLIAQLLTTNWYILFDGVRRLRIGWRCYSMEVALPAIVVFFAACLAVFAAVEGIPPRWNPMNGIVAAATAAAGIFVSAFWLVGLNTADRARVRAWGRGALRRLLVDLP